MELETEPKWFDSRWEEIAVIAAYHWVGSYFYWTSIHIWYTLNNRYMWNSMKKEINLFVEKKVVAISHDKTVQANSTSNHVEMK